MEKLKKILEAEIAQRKLAMKHNLLNKAEIAEELDELNQGLVKLFAIPDVSGSLSWIEKDRLAGIRLNEMRALAVENSILNEVSSKVLRQLIIEGINIGLNYR